MGMYRIGPMDLEASDPFGIFSLKKRIECITELTVYPPIHIPERLGLMQFPLIKKIGEEMLSEAGYASDFRGQREYRREDPKKMIHWLATAKHRRLIVKEFEENVITDVGIFTDYRRLSLRGTGNLTTLVLGLNTAASVAAAAMQKFHRFGISFIGYQKSHDMVFGTGVHHLHYVLHSMVTLGSPGKYSDYCSEVEEKLHTVKKNGTAVFIVNHTPTDQAGLLDIVKSCVRRGVKPVVALINDRTFLKLFPEQLEIDKDAPELSKAAGALKKEGAAVYVLSKGDIPAHEIDASTEIQARKTA
jgi:uncharacterized protein (DUF58 family)